MTDDAKTVSDQRDARRRFLKLGVAAAGTSVLPVRAAYGVASSINCTVILPPGSSEPIQQIADELVADLAGNQREAARAQLLQDYEADEGRALNVVDTGEENWNPLTFQGDQPSQLGVAYLERLSEGSVGGPGSSCLASAMTAISLTRG